MVRFDAYAATSASLRHHEALGFLASMERGDSIREGRGFHTFASRAAVVDAAGDEVASVSWGGRQGERVMIEVKGERTPEAVERLRSGWEHRCTRVDSCVDFERPGAWDELLAPVLAVKSEHRLYGERRGDWEMPEFGRTQYLGANSSAVRARLYEKGKQPEFRHLARFDLVRLELQIRPQKDAKTQYATLSPEQVWGASKWTRELAAEVLQRHLDAYPPGTVRKHSERDQKVRWACKQYGVALCSLAYDLGSWECLGLTLKEVIADIRREESKR